MAVQVDVIRLVPVVVNLLVPELVNMHARAVNTPARELAKMRAIAVNIPAWVLAKVPVIQLADIHQINSLYPPHIKICGG